MKEGKDGENEEGDGVGEISVMVLMNWRFFKRITATLWEEVAKQREC